MHDDDDRPGAWTLVPVDPQTLSSVELVEGFAFQSGQAVTAGAGEPDLALARVMLMHLATRRNYTDERGATVASMDKPMALQVLGGFIEAACVVYGDDAINAVVGGLVKVYGPDLPPLPTTYPGE